MNRIRRKITKRSIITTTVIVLIFVMSLGYAALSQHMDIDGIAQVDRSWIIKITNVTSSVTNGGVDKSKTYIGTTVTMNASLPTSTSTVTYKITFQNQGNLSAKLSAIEKIEDENTSITYTITGVIANENGQTLLDPGNTATATVTIKYQSGVTSASNIDKSLMLSFDFVEAKTLHGGSWVEGPTTTDNATYKKGDIVTLKGGSTWQVTKDSSGAENMVTLAATNVLNSTGGFATSASDAYKKAFDTTGKNQYNPKSSSNIGYFIDNTFLPKIKTSITNAGGNSTTTTARLMTEEELSMRIMTGCTTSMAGYCRIYGSNSGIGYWTMSPSGSSNVVIHDTDSGPYSGTASPTATTYTILPVITTAKGNIQTVDLGNRIAYVDNKVLGEKSTLGSKPSATFDGYESKPSSTTSTISFTSSTSYCFGTSYKFDPSSSISYTLAGSTKCGTWSSMSTEFATYPYTLKNTSATATSNRVYKMTSYTSATAGVGYTISATNVRDEGNGGVYYASDNDGRSIFFRGNITNNYVKFANKYWRIIRVNGDGSVRLIYQGTAATSTGTAATIGNSPYNSSLDNPYYVGYMYGRNNDSYALAHLSVDSSTIKTTLDEWYTSNLQSYASYLADAGFCNNRQVRSGDGYSIAALSEFGPSPTSTFNNFICPQQNDLFTLTSSSKGNKALTKPIGLISYNELILAGLAYGVTSPSNYLDADVYFWSMSPYIYTYRTTAASTQVYLVDSGSSVEGAVVTTSYGVRPVINLKTDVKTITGNGTKTNPYVIT